MLKVTCPRDSLFEAMQVVSRAVSGRSTLPILNNVLIEGSGDALRLVATDLELSIEASIPATVEEEGALTAPARVLAEVVQNLPSPMPESRHRLGDVLSDRQELLGLF